MFTDSLDKVINLEGKYSNHKSDSGGKTMYGVTEQVARRYGYKGLMSSMPIDVAKGIYYKYYWEPLMLDDVHKLSPSIAEELFDTGVNQGTGRAAEYLQKSLNGLNRQGKDYADIRVDGDVGAATIRALVSFLRKRSGQGELVLLRCLNSLQGSFYINLATSRPKDQDFLYGWILNRVSI